MEARHRYNKRRRRTTNDEEKPQTPEFTKISLDPPSFADLPTDIFPLIFRSMSAPELMAASATCREWRECLSPLREAGLFFRWGKRYRRGGHGVEACPEKALDCFEKAAARGYAPAMVDAGIMYWERGRREDAIRMFRKGAEARYPAAMFNLGNCYFEGDSPDPQEAVKWFYQAALSGYARAQFNLALCLRSGRGVKCNLRYAAEWNLKAANGGYAPAMYNASLCYSSGEGGKRDPHRARLWMKCAADGGHGKALYDHGQYLFKEGICIKALLYFELAARAGETAAADKRDEIIQSYPEISRDKYMQCAMISADKWKPRKFKGLYEWTT